MVHYRDLSPSTKLMLVVIFMLSAIIGIFVKKTLLPNFPIKNDSKAEVKSQPESTEVVEVVDVIDAKIEESVNEVYDLHRKDKLSSESKAKLDKLKIYFEENPDKISVRDSYIKATSVFVDLDIPIQEHQDAHKYLIGEIE